jgi:hypothetical protein
MCPLKGRASTRLSSFFKALVLSISAKKKAGII